MAVTFVTPEDLQPILNWMAETEERLSALEQVQPPEPPDPPIPPDPPPSGRSLLGQSDFTFLGSFDVSGNIAVDLNWGQGFTHRYVNGQLRFLCTAYGSGNPVLVEFPGTSYGQTVVSAFRTWPGIALAPTLGAAAKFNIWWDAENNRLFKTEWVDYPDDVLRLDAKSISTRTLNDNGTFSNVRGLFGTEGIGGRAAVGGIRKVPAWFQSAHGVGKYCIGFGGYTSRMAQTLMASMGPFLATIPEPTADIPASQIKILADHRSGSAAAQDWYPSGQPTAFDRGARNADVNNEFDSNRYWKSPAPDGLGRWVWGDNYHGCGEWIDNDAGTRNKHGFLTVGTFYSGRAWYEGSTLHCDRRTAEIHIFNPAHLAEVKNGTRQPWNVKPVSRIDITNIMKQGCDALRGRDGAGVEGAASGSTFDATTNTLYIMSYWAHNTPPYSARVYAFRIGGD